MDHEELRRAARVSGVDPSTRLRQADRALRAAETAGKGTWRMHQPELVGAAPRSNAPTTGVPAPRAGRAGRPVHPAQVAP